MAAPLTFGTAFASAGFTVDPNFSPNNQGFVNAVLAVCGRAGLPFGFEAANVVLAGPTAGVAALPAYRAIVTADLPATVGTVLGVDAVMGGAGTSCGVWTNQHITTVGTATLTLNAFNGTLAGLVPSSSGGSTNYLRADGSYAQPPGTTVGANPTATVGTAAVNGVATTFMRSDGAPAISTAMSPTWTGTHTFAGPVATTKAVADQGYSLQTPSTGFNITIADNTGSLLLNPAGTLLAGTVTTPANPLDGQFIRVATSQTITTMTMAANSGQTIDNAFAATLAAGTGLVYQYNLSGTKWYRIS